MKHQETHGRMKNLKGRAKEAAGIVTGNVALEQEGARQRAEGDVETSIGRVRETVGEFIEGVAEKIKK
jgi:uncharacterized protein YjbJ (UPF0337 family)